MTRPGTEAQPLRVAIVGAGPTGFYATDQLFRQPGLVVDVDMYDRVPTPYGLVRAGVAPDHQKIKSVTAAFDKVAAHSRFRFFGAVELGRHLSVDDLRGDAALTYGTLIVLGNGFILTAVLWGWALVTMIERRFLVTAAVLAVASLATLVGLVHSPLPGGAVFWPWAESAPRAITLPLAGAYGVLASVCAAASLQRR